MDHGDFPFKYLFEIFSISFILYIHQIYFYFYFAQTLAGANLARANVCTSVGRAPADGQSTGDESPAGDY